MASMKDFESDKYHRNLIALYLPIIQECLIPSQVFPSLPFLRSHMSALRRLERAEGSPAATLLFLEKLLASNERGWFQAFVHALEEAEFTYLVKVLTGDVVKDSHLFRNLLAVYMPLLRNIIPSDIMCHLQDEKCLSNEDVSYITAVQTQEGVHQAACVLLDHVARKDEHWFAKLMWCLLKVNQAEMVTKILSEEAASADSLQTMMDLVKKLADIHDGPLFQDPEPMDLAEGVFELNFNYMPHTSGEKLYAQIPEDDRSRHSPEGQAESGACREEDMIVHSTMDDTTKRSTTSPKRSASPDDNITETKRAAGGATYLNNLNVDGSEKSFSSIKSVDMDVCDSGLNEARGGDGAETPTVFNIPEPQVEPKDLELRSYQEELAGPAMAGRNIIVALPTGSGKTHVALRITQHHFDTAEPGHDPKVVFLVPTTALVLQQWKMFKTFINGPKSIGIHGDMQIAVKVPFQELVQNFDVIIMTAQILVDALKYGSLSLSVFSLLFYDECHHAMKVHPYAAIQYYYLRDKLKGPQPCQLPQIVGLTASVGVGKKTRTLDGAVNHILKLCANLGTEELPTVENNRIELYRHVITPNEERKEVRGRQDDPFQRSVFAIMSAIEVKMRDSPEMRQVNQLHPDTGSQLASPPSERGSERYTEWLGKLKKPVARIRGEDTRRLFYACVRHLDMYNSALLLNADCRTQDALNYIVNKLGDLQPQYADDTDYWLHKTFEDRKDYLQQISNDPSNANPKLDEVKRIMLKHAQEKPDLRAIIFCKTREMTVALMNWMNEDAALKLLGTNRLAGKGPSTEKAGMNQAQQDDVLMYFRDGKYKVIVATTVAEEGLDIKKCNLVIRYEHVTNEIAYVQARGRGRAEDAQYLLVAASNSGMTEREDINQMRERTMEKALKQIRALSPPLFQRKVEQYQKEILMEWERRELGKKAQKVKLNGSDDDEEDFEIRCMKCNQLACLASDVRKVEESHHVVIDLYLLEVSDIEPHPRPGAYGVFEKTGKIYCKECHEDWGIQALYKKVKLQVIKISAFVIVCPGGARETCKKWKDVPFDVARLDTDELATYVDQLGRDMDN